MIQLSKLYVWTVYGQVWCNGTQMPMLTDDKSNDFSLLASQLFPTSKGLLTFENGTVKFYDHLEIDPSNVWTLYQFNSELEELIYKQKYL